MWENASGGPRYPGRPCRYGRLQTAPCQLTAWVYGSPPSGAPMRRATIESDASHPCELHGGGELASGTTTASLAIRHTHTYCTHRHTTRRQTDTHQAASAGNLGPRSARCYSPSCGYWVRWESRRKKPPAAAVEKAKPVLPIHVRPAPAPSMDGQVGSNVSSLGNGAGPTLIPLASASYRRPWNGRASPRPPARLPLLLFMPIPYLYT